MHVEDLGTLPYRDGWALQEQVHAEVVGGGGERILLVEHPPVITCGRRPNVAKHLRATPDHLAKLNVEFVESDRGGDITFHGPGQLVVYPIIRLIDHHLSVGAYVRLLEQAVIAALGELGIRAQKDACAVGVWAKDGAALAKLCALGVRVRRGVTMHGIALNVTTDLSYFDLIVPCGLSGRPVTSVQKLLGGDATSMERMKQTLARHLLDALGSAVDAAPMTP